MAKSSNIYLTNKELLIAIHKSKMTYVEIDDPKYYYYDAIIYDLDVLMDDEICTNHYGEWHVIYDIPVMNKKTETIEITHVDEIITNFWSFNKHKDSMKRVMILSELVTPVTSEEFILKIKQNTAKKQNKEKRDNKNPDLKITADDILTGDLVFRLMTFDHIPDDENWGLTKPKKKASDGYIKVNFPPFQIFIIENGIPRCVGLSHYKDGKFNLECGRMTEILGEMFIRLVDRIGKKGSFRNYTYLDEMKGLAQVQLSQVGLLFDEGRSANPNPFAFYTTVIQNIFKRVLNTEKQNRNVRDDLIEMAGQNPSYSRQSESDWKTMNEGYIKSEETALFKKRQSRNN